MINNGQDIKLFHQLDAIAAHFLSPKRLGGAHVLQRYISHPHLLKGPQLGHKYSLRLFVVLSNFNGNALYPQGYFNIALTPYLSDDFSDLRAHLTNEHLYEGHKNVVQIPSQQYPVFQRFYPEIQRIVKQVIRGLKQQYPQAFIETEARNLAIFGFDFMLDADEKVWLLEVNHCPCFPVEETHPLQTPLYHAFWQAVVDEFIMPLARSEKNPFQQFKALS